jgi:hypothetical protein
VLRKASHGHPVVNPSVMLAVNPSVMLAVSSKLLAVFDAAAACAGLLKPAKDVGRRELESISSMVGRMFACKAATIGRS